MLGAGSVGAACGAVDDCVEANADHAGKPRIVPAGMVARSERHRADVHLPCGEGRLNIKHGRVEFRLLATDTGLVLLQNRIEPIVVL